MAPLHAPLRLAEQGKIGLPVAMTAPFPGLLQPLLTLLPQSFEQFVFQRDEELTAAGVALASGTAEQLAIDADRVVSFRGQHVQTPRRRDARRQFDVRA